MFSLQLKATASWDSTVHNNSSLNKVTGSNDRVYAILKVAVALTHPPGIDLVLRKRICLRVDKRRRFGSTFMKAIMPTGVSGSTVMIIHPKSNPNVNR